MNAPRQGRPALDGTVVAFALTIGALLGPGGLAPSSARADDRADEKAACATAAEESQQLRIDGKLRAARDRLLACSRPTCPATVLRDCTQWMSEVTGLMPTVVPAARDALGRDRLDVRVSIDGVVVIRGLDGKAIEVDPGAHTFRFEAPGAASVEQAVLVREGEKGRPVTVTLAAAVPSGPDVMGRTPGEGAAPPPVAPSSSAWAWPGILGGAGVAFLGLGAALELSVNADASGLQGTCGHACSHAQVDPLVLRQQVLGPIAFGVGALSLGVATYWLLRRHGGAPAAAPASLAAPLRWDVAPSSGGAGATVTGTF